MIVPLGDTYYGCFTTRQFSTGAPFTLAGTPALSTKEEANDTIITAGVTLDVDTGATPVTGLNEFAIVASGANRYEVGKYYSVYISTGTVDSVSAVGEVVGHFRVGPAEDAGAGIPDVNVATWLDTAVTLSGTTSKPEVDVFGVSDDATTANNLQTLYDGNEGFLSAYAGPRGPGVWIDGSVTSTGTTAGVNGTVTNPLDGTVTGVANAKTLADALGCQRIYLKDNASITLASSFTDYEIVGIGDLASNTVNLGSQIVTSAAIHNCLVTGAQGSVGRLSIFGGAVTGVTGFSAYVYQAAITGNITVAADCWVDSCWSAVAGNGTPVLDINSVANIDISWRHYSGGLQINNAVATTTLSYESDGQLIIGATCTSLAATIRGCCSLTDSGTTSSITQMARVAPGDAIPASPTADSPHQRLAAIDDLTQASGAGDLAALVTTVGTAGDGLTAINLPDQTMNITGDITGNLSGSVGSVDGHTAQSGDTFALANGATGFVAIDTVVDAILAMLDDDRGEPSGVPPLSADMATE